MGSQLCHYPEVLSKRSSCSWCHRENWLHQGWWNRAKSWPLPAFPCREQHLPGGKKHLNQAQPCGAPSSACEAAPAPLPSSCFPSSGSEDPMCPSHEQFWRPMEPARWKRRDEGCRAQHEPGGCCEAPAPLVLRASSRHEEKVVQLILPDCHRLSRVMQKYLTST